MQQKYKKPMKMWTTLRVDAQFHMLNNKYFLLIKGGVF